MRDDNRLAFQTLDVYIAAKQLAQRVQAAKIADKELREQATDAAKSTFLRLSEGLPLTGAGMRSKYFNEADGSLCETLAAMDLAEAIGAARTTDADAVQALGVRIKRMIRGLLHSR
jgi:four helix bundle protein